MPRRVLEVVLAEEAESGLPADRVRGRVGHRRERMHEAAAALGAGCRDRLHGGGGGDPAPLETGDHRPADLVHLVAAPLAIPVADPSGRLASVADDDPELPRAGLAVSRVAAPDLFRALRPTQM